MEYPNTTASQADVLEEQKSNDLSGLLRLQLIAIGRQPPREQHRQTGGVDASHHTGIHGDTPPTRSEALLRKVNLM